MSVLSYSACVVNGIKFVCYARDINRTTQNSGVHVPGIDDQSFYGELQNVLVLQYLFNCHAVFRCKWFDTDLRKKRIKRIQNITSIYVNPEWYKDNSFVLTTQARQVFYTEDRLHSSAWKVVHHYFHHHVLDIPTTVVVDIGRDGTLGAKVLQETSSETFECG